VEEVDSGEQVKFISEKELIEFLRRGPPKHGSVGNRRIGRNDHEDER
jgi:hypothetical protein